MTKPKPKPKRRPPPASGGAWFAKFEFAKVYAGHLAKILKAAGVVGVDRVIEDLRRAVESYTITLTLRQQWGTLRETRDRLARVAGHAEALAAELLAMDGRARRLFLEEWVRRHPGQVIELHDVGMWMYDFWAIAGVAAGKIETKPGRATEHHSHAELIERIETILAPHGIALAEGGKFLAVASEIFAAADLGSSSPKDGIAALRTLREESSKAG